MASVALVSILCADRVGLVSAISDHLFDAGVNLRDTIFAALGAGAGFTSVCELPTTSRPKRWRRGCAGSPCSRARRYASCPIRSIRSRARPAA